MTTGKRRFHQAMALFRQKPDWQFSIEVSGEKRKAPETGAFVCGAAYQAARELP